MKKLNKIQQIVYDALFLALFFVFAYVPYLGYINIGTLAFTTMHILVIIGALLFGKRRGILYGFFFGITSLVIAINYPGTLNYFCLNPFISILPRVLFGLISGLLFDFLRTHCSQKKFNILIIFSSGLLTLVHTILYFVCFYIFGILDIFKISSLLGLSDLIDLLFNQYGGFISFILSTMSIGSICEIVAAMVICSAIYIPLNKFFKIGSANKIEIKFNQNKIVLITFIIFICLLLSVIIFSLII